MKKVDLQCIQNGAVIEMFDEELRKVLLNIEDENTMATAERSVTVKISIKPDKKRKTGDIKIQVSSVVAKVKPAESYLVFGKDNDGQFCAYEDDPGPELPGMSEQQPETDKVKSFPKASNGG